MMEVVDCWIWGLQMFPASLFRSETEAPVADQQAPGACSLHIILLDLDLLRMYDQTSNLIFGR